MCHTGDSVLYGKYDGMAVEYDGAQHVLIRDDDVLLTWNGPAMTIDAVSTVRDRCVRAWAMSVRECVVVLYWTGGLLSSSPLEARREVVLPACDAARLTSPLSPRSSCCRILVKVKKAQEKTAGGILLAPSMNKQR
jgi:co-chaperonin GroES (HSP10)